MQLDPKITVAGAPVVTLAGAQYFVPALALRQTRIVVPNLLTLLPALERIQGNAQAGMPVVIATEHVDMMVDTVHAALTRAYPDAMRDDVLDCSASFTELAAALAVIARQTGLFAPAAPGDSSGEA